MVEREGLSHIATRMEHADELQATRTPSRPGFLFLFLGLGSAEKKPQRKKMFGGPVVALSRVMIAIESRMTLMTSKDAFDGTHG